MQIKNVIIASLLLIVSVQSKAALISVDYLSAGDGLITQDTDTGLQWLDLTYSTNISFNDMEVLLASDSFYNKFRRATVSEFNQLFLNADVGTLNVRTTNNRDIAGVQLLTALLGDTLAYSGSQRNGGMGFTGTIVDPDSSNPIRGADYFTTTERGFLESWVGDQAVASADFAVPFIGHYLVSTVPIPGTVWLFGSGLIGLVGFARRKK
jgi:hypothetical protein